jgi:hypothetical protein
MFGPFDSVIASTLCPFAARAKVGSAPEWDVDRCDNWPRIAESLRVWLGSAEATRSHGFVVQIGGCDASDFDSVRQAFRVALEELNRLDSSDSSCLREEVDAPHWQFEFEGVRLFANVFAPCYPPAHSKRIDDPGHFYIFFQPDFSFDLCGITRESREIKLAIRRRFDEAGRPYSGELIDRRIEAEIYMFPVDVTDAPVRWWE